MHGFAHPLHLGHLPKYFIQRALNVLLLAGDFPQIRKVQELSLFFLLHVLELLLELLPVAPQQASGSDKLFCKCTSGEVVDGFNHVLGQTERFHLCSQTDPHPSTATSDLSYGVTFTCWRGRWEELPQIPRNRPGRNGCQYGYQPA